MIVQGGSCFFDRTFAERASAFGFALQKVQPRLFVGPNSNEIIPTQGDLASILVAHPPDRNLKFKFFLDKLRGENFAKVARPGFFGARQSFSQYLSRRFVSQLFDVVGNALKGVVMGAYRLRQLSLSGGAPVWFLGEFQEEFLAVFFRTILEPVIEQGHSFALSYG